MSTITLFSVVGASPSNGPDAVASFHGVFETLADAKAEAERRADRYKTCQIYETRKAAVVEPWDCVFSTGPAFTRSPSTGLVIPLVLAPDGSFDASMFRRPSDGEYPGHEHSEFFMEALRSHRVGNGTTEAPPHSTMRKTPIGWDDEVEDTRGERRNARRLEYFRLVNAELAGKKPV